MYVKWKFLNLVINLLVNQVVLAAPLQSIIQTLF